MKQTFIASLLLIALSLPAMAGEPACRGCQPKPQPQSSSFFRKEVHRERRGWFPFFGRYKVTVDKEIVR